MKKELPFIHLARVSACAAVVLIHTISSNVASLSKISPFIWWIDNVIDSAIVWAVPLFVMLSGALLLSPKNKETWYAFYRKRFFRIGIPTFFWVIFYYIFFNLLNNTSISLISFFKQVVFEQPFMNLYFLFIILELYVLTPFIKSITSSLNKSQGLYLSILFLFIGIFWRYQRFVGTMFIPYLGFFLLGYYLREHVIRFDQRKILAVYFLVITSFIAVGTYLFSSHIVYNFNDDFFFYHHTNIFVIASVIIVYLFFKSYNQELVTHEKLYKLIKYISNKTLGIYILHWPIRVLFFYFIFGTKDIIFPIPINLQVILFLFLFISSAILTSILQKLPLIRYIV